MKIPELFKNGHTVFSFEVFPPKKDADVSVIYDTLDQLGDLHPDFISVTYGAGGSTSKRTVEIAADIQSYGIPLRELPPPSLSATSRRISAPSPSRTLPA